MKIKTRTSLVIGPNGVVRCYTGDLRSFVMDIAEFVLPLVESSLYAEFNGRKIVITNGDTSGDIYSRFMKELNN